MNKLRFCAALAITAATFSSGHVLAQAANVDLHTESFNQTSGSGSLRGAYTQTVTLVQDRNGSSLLLNESFVPSGTTGTAFTQRDMAIVGVATAAMPTGDSAVDDPFLNWAASVDYVEQRLAAAGGGGGGGGVAPDADGNIIIDADDTVTSSQLLINANTINLGVTNAGGQEHGIFIGTTQTVISGGTSTTTITLTDDGADFGGAQITGIAAGTADNDAVNLSQLNAAVASVNGAINGALDSAYAGIAIANAMDVVLPQEGNNLSMRLGAGYYGSASAYGLTVVGRVRDNVFIDVAYGLSTEKNSGSSNGGKAGITFQW